MRTASRKGRPSTAPLSRKSTTGTASRLPELSPNVKKPRRNELRPDMAPPEDEEELENLKEVLDELRKEKERLRVQIAATASGVLDAGEVAKLEARLEAARALRREATMKINGMGACFSSGKSTMGKVSPVDAEQRREHLEVKHSIHCLNAEVGHLRLKLDTLKNEINECEKWEAVTQDEKALFSQKPTHLDAERELKRLINEKHRIMKRVEEANAAHVAAIRQEAQVARQLNLLEKRTCKYTRETSNPSREKVLPKVENAQFLHTAADLNEWRKFSHAQCGPSFCHPIRVVAPESPRKTAFPAPPAAGRDTPCWSRSDLTLEGTDTLSSTTSLLKAQ